ncbi:MAG TPA: FG-GAP-like repeat-containing protein [Saprospiraceae bacterium]|nr:FG-GAP-like repeat-containing protein [Saprospiraceae bacterium]HMQ83285.1 FG-GAP-like repeat-containing protein [Saprospiraceae bacterium]
MKEITCFLLLTLPAWLPAQLFTDASQQLPDNGAKGQSMDVRAADLDNDGDLDIVLANEFQANTLLMNGGNGIFSNGTSGNLPQEVHDSEDVAIADFNNDGFLDLVFCSEDDITLGWSNVHEYYLGNGTGQFVTASFQPSDSEANAVVSTDLNLDGFPDLLFGNNGGTGVLINDGTGQFISATERVPQLQRTTQDLAMADVDMDGDLDLMEGNENGNVLCLNDGQGFFSDVSASHLPQGLNIETRKIAFGDIDQDGDVDVFLSNVAFIPGKMPQNRLFENDGSGHYTDITATHLPSDSDHTIDGIFEDLDLDGDLDLIVANVFGAPVKIYENAGDGHFGDATLSVLGMYYYRDALGVIAEDFNGDGLNDLYICDRKLPQNDSKDLLLLRHPISAIPQLEPLSDQIRLFPNPAKSFIYLSSNSELPDTMTLYDNTGRHVSTLSANADEGRLYKIDLPKGLASGLYYLQIAVGIQKPMYIHWE